VNSRRLRTLCAVLSLCLLLTACASRTELGSPANPDFSLHQQAVLAHPNWQLNGRLNFKQAKQSNTVSIHWQQQGQHFDITLRSTLLGLGSTHVYGTENDLMAETAGSDPVRLPNLQALTRDYLHFEFPAAYLLYWVRGLPVPELSALTKFDSNNLLADLSQLDPTGRRWQLTFDRYELSDSLPLPGRIQLTDGEVQLTFLVSDWQLDAATP
jgi:outer membrane lipoprotein LolB